MSSLTFLVLLGLGFLFLVLGGVFYMVVRRHEQAQRVEKTPLPVTVMVFCVTAGVACVLFGLVAHYKN